MSGEEEKSKRGPRPGGTWVWIDDKRKQAIPVKEGDEIRWKLLTGEDVTPLVESGQPRPARPQKATGPDGRLHMQVDQPLKVVIVTEAEGLNCLENLFYLTDAMKEIADELKKIREILEADPSARENLRVARELQKSQAMGGRKT